MSLDPIYIQYAKRQRGTDHDLYGWSKLFDRPSAIWAGVVIWIVVSLEWFPITPSDTPFRALGYMQTAYPDYRHYSACEYGTRIASTGCSTPLLKLERLHRSRPTPRSPADRRHRCRLT